MACTVGPCCARVKTLESRYTDCLSRAVMQIGNPPTLVHARDYGYKLGGALWPCNGSLCIHVVSLLIG